MAMGTSLKQVEFEGTRAGTNHKGFATIRWKVEEEVDSILWEHVVGSHGLSAFC